MAVKMSENGRHLLSATSTAQMRQAVRNLEDELWFFEWKDYGGVSGGEFFFEEKEDGTVMVMMTVWVHNSDDLEDEEVASLNVGIAIDENLPADEQLRELVHMFICHEADERLFFGEKHEQRFYPEHPRNS